MKTLRSTLRQSNNAAYDGIQVIVVGKSGDGTYTYASSGGMFYPGLSWARLLQHLEMTGTPASVKNWYPA